ncbi:helix-turn-helix domain-containing protein [Haloferax volcanii]|uniref:AlbA family DNA-binding domain-containing protein n=2 Tax=Haloferax TaxID=2251 RepID=UPI00349F32F2
MQVSSNIESWKIDTVKTLSQRGEGNRLEFKGILKHEATDDSTTSQSEWRHKLETEFTAFANAEGGTILFGITDSGNITGVPVPEERFNGFLNNLLSDVNPQLDLHTTEIPLPTDDEPPRVVLVVKVNEADTKPVQTSRASYYIRINESAQPMTRGMVQSTFLADEEQFSARRDLELRLEQYAAVYKDRFTDVDAASNSPPNFGEIQADALRDSITRFLRYGAYEPEAELMLKETLRVLDELDSLDERFHLYVRGDMIAFEYGRGEIADSSSDYKKINRRARDDLHQIADTLYHQIEPLADTDDLEFEA